MILNKAIMCDVLNILRVEILGTWAFILSSSIFSIIIDKLMIVFDMETSGLIRTYIKIHSGNDPLNKYIARHLICLIVYRHSFQICEKIPIYRYLALIIQIFLRQ